MKLAHFGHFRRIPFAVFLMIGASLSLPLPLPLLGSENALTSAIRKMVEAGTRKLQSTILENAGLGRMSEIPSWEDSGMRMALGRSLQGMLTANGENHYTYLTIGNVKKPIEITGLSLDNPAPLPVNDADRLNGIDLRILFYIKAKAHRTFETGSGWSEWKPGKPALMSAITLEKKRGAWKVAGDSSKYYAAH